MGIGWVYTQESRPTSVIELWLDPKIKHVGVF
jgi:hypothetical protein